MLLYFNNNLYVWLYSLKQWTISIEVPRQLRGTDDQSGLHISRITYNVIKWLGIVINFFVAFLVAYFRFKLMT